MNAMRRKQFEAFLKEKQEIQESLAADFTKAFEELGEDIKHLEWFPSCSSRVKAEQVKAA